MGSVFHSLSQNDLEKIKSLGSQVVYPADQLVFSEGDLADCLYFVEAGKVSIYIDKFNTRDAIGLAQPGDWFGEMAMFNGNRRNANAITQEETRFLSISCADFKNLLAEDGALKQVITSSVDRRNMELVLKEKLIDSGAMWSKDFHISIKGDPSLRESAMQRNRYESVVDKCLPTLVEHLQELLLERTAYQVTLGFNNGEIRISTLLDPFSEEFHPAARLLDKSYLERHFPVVAFDEKTAFIQGIYENIQQHKLFVSLPDHLKVGLGRYLAGWEPVSKETIQQILSQLTTLRSIPDFYVRSLTVGVLKDTIQMQFNCDGTHIVRAQGFERFINENL